LQKAGVQSELVIVPGGQHGPGVMEAGYYAKMVDFFRKELKEKK
jgi:dipeptidyl aminopeptidase/acylaminoacyl peptidase